jgi:uncharacterized protein (DUF2237 family)
MTAARNGPSSLAVGMAADVARRFHALCPGKSWCDCAHRIPEDTPDA